jgi:tetratricopeptide (TPR) repeat protein
MKLQKRFFFMIVALVWLSGNICAQTPQTELSFSNLRLELSTTKKIFVQIEPIPIFLKVSNTSNSPVSGHTALNFSDGFVRLSVTYNGKALEVNNLTNVIFNSGIERTTINSGETVEYRQEWVHDLDKVFTKAGTYQIQAILRGLKSNETIKSNQITIHIHNPTGLDLEAVKYLSNYGNPSRILSGQGAFYVDDPRTILEAFVSKFSETAYGNYGAMLLTELYLYKKEFEPAIEQLEKILNKGDFAFNDQVLYYLTQAYGHLGNTDKAHHYLDILKRQYPKYPYIQNAESEISIERERKQ